MLKRYLWAFLCIVILIGKIHAQEVIVAREKKPEPPKKTPQPSQQATSESPTPAPPKSASHENKSAPATLTLEEMRTAGARAAEGLDTRRVSQPTKTHEADTESAPVPSATVAETPRPLKRETPVEQRSSSGPEKPRSTNLEGIGPIRPTMIESGRQEPTVSPTPKWQARGEQSPAP
ncbi:MAG TPA: hypothetical protein VKD89_10700 [Candidatus Udaeobacter sp.]|nr:hypothetical protein [Candidatus Udaeobacter sp.]